MTRRLVISDLHIGSKFYQPKKVLKMLEYEKYDELILAGDIIDFLKVPEFTKNCLVLIKAIANSPRVIYINGNHDISFKDWNQQEIFGIEFMNEYNIVVNGRKIRIVHGDQFQPGIVKMSGIMKLLSIVQDQLERIFGIDVTKFLHEKILKRLELKNIENILSENDDIDVLIMGHTHTPEALVWIQPDQGIKTYVNSGDWVSSCTYVTIESDGEVRLRKFEENNER